MDADDLQGVIAILEEWKASVKKEQDEIRKAIGHKIPLTAKRIISELRGEETGLQMAINALSHFVEE